MRVNQLLPSLAKGDAVSNNAFALHALLKEWGYDAGLYSMLADPRIKKHRRDYSELAPGPEDLTIYHYSIGCKPVSKHFAGIGGKKMLIYHNVTPERFLEGYDDKLVAFLRDGRESLGMFKDQVVLAVGDSDFNTEELREAGYRNPKTLPILLDMSPLYKTRRDTQMLRYLAGGEWTTFLFTGRIAPNKKQEDVIRAFAWYHHHINKASQLVLVGDSTLPKYMKKVKAAAEEHGVSDFVVFTGHVTFPELVACYQSADIFMSMSEHEGFCVPLLEAMHYEVPILAYKATGVPCTMGDAGVLFTEKNAPLVGEMAHLMLTDAKLRARIVAKQNERLADFAPEKISALFKGMVEGIVGPA